MTTWQQFTEQAPELETAVRGRFEAHLHHVLATLRRDGSPRVSGTEARFFEGELYLGCMPGSRKAADLRADARLALHAATVDVELRDGDAKVAGRAVEVGRDEADRFLASLGHEGDHDGAPVFRVDVTEAVLTRVQNDELVVDAWHEGQAPTTRRRK